MARYLFAHPHRPVMYPRLPLHGLHILRQDYDNGKYDDHRITNEIAIFADADHARDQKTRKSMDSIFAILNGVIIDYKVAQQNCIALHSTDAEIRTTFSATKRAVYLFALARFIDLQCANKPITIYQDSQPCIEVVESNAMSSRVKHIAVPVLYVHEQIAHDKIRMEYIKTAIQPADPGTKPTSAPVMFRAFDYLIGVRHYPPADSEHAKLMDLPSFNASRNFSIISTSTWKAANSTKTTILQPKSSINITPSNSSSSSLST